MYFTNSGNDNIDTNSQNTFNLTKINYYMFIYVDINLFRDIVNNNDDNVINT